MPAGRFYRTKNWLRLRAQALRAQPICATPRCGAASTDVDHIQPRPRGTDGLTAADVLNNLRCYCRACHSRKTARRDGGFGRQPSRRVAVGADGWPEGVGVSQSLDAGGAEPFRGIRKQCRKIVGRK